MSRKLPAEQHALPLPALAMRDADSHKGDFGRTLLIGGSRGMAGAIGLAGMAALRSGAGLVQLAVPEPCLDVVAGYEPSYMTAALPADAAGRFDWNDRAQASLAELASAATAIACGPGLGRSDGGVALVHWLQANVSQPVVFDADALNALAARPEGLLAAAGPRILTPHPGEFSRLTGGAVPRDDDARLEQARDAASRWGAIVVLKGHRTVITDGVRWAVNQTGNPGMATGGTGDVLTGVIVALVSQGLSPLDAAHLGVHVHGLAGDLAVVERSQIGLIARDLVEHLPAAWRHVAPAD